MLHLAAVSAGVHAHGAADCTGDTVGKFQTRQSPLAGKVRHTGKGGACHGKHFLFCGNTVVNRCFDAIHFCCVDHQAIQPRIGDQQIRAVADYQHLRAALLGKIDQHHHLFAVYRKGHTLCRTADTKRGMLRHRHILLIGQVGQMIRYFFIQTLIPEHFFLSHQMRFFFPSSAAPMMPARVPSSAFTTLVILSRLQGMLSCSARRCSGINSCSSASLLTPPPIASVSG